MSISAANLQRAQTDNFTRNGQRAPRYLTPAQQAKQGKDKHGIPLNVEHPADKNNINKSSVRYALIDYRPGTPEIIKRKDSLIAGTEDHQTKRRNDEHTLKQFKKRESEKAKKPPFWKRLFPQQPSDDIELEEKRQDELARVALRAFPRRMNQPIWICDVMKTSGIVRRETTLGDIERYWKEKPPNVILRWIHAPVGTGTIHSSLEDMFLHHEEPGRPFKHAGYHSFPYLSVDVLHFRDKDEVQHMRNVYQQLQPLKELRRILNRTCMDGDKNETLADDMRWRLQRLGKSLDFWELAKSDFPYELSEGYSYGDDGPLKAEGLGAGPLDESVLDNRSVQFNDAHLVVAPFRFFHRQDGVLLTMSAATGVDALHRDFQAHIRDTLHGRLGNSECSVVAQQMRALEKEGAQDWYEHSIEWFLVYLITEFSAMPSTYASGLSATSINSAMQSAMQDMKRRRYDLWEKTTTVKLVKEHLVCIDQLKFLSVACGRRLSMLENLAKDCAEQREYDEGIGDKKTPNNPDGESACSRIKWALRAGKEAKAGLDYQLEDMTRSLKTLFQLQTIQQGELTLTADKHNKAIMVVTSVTVVFLPLSFASSYFGMNFKDIRALPQTQDYFWEVCFTSTILIVALVLLCAFQNRYMGQLLGKLICDTPLRMWKAKAKVNKSEAEDV